MFKDDVSIKMAKTYKSALNIWLIILTYANLTYSPPVKGDFKLYLIH